jgi:hypothetical protein
MGGNDLVIETSDVRVEAEPGSELLREIVEAQNDLPSRERSMPGVVVGRLVGLGDERQMPLVVFPGQPGAAALPARSVANVTEEMLGSDVTLMFENGDARKPIIMGYLHGIPTASEEKAVSVQVDADGQRVMLSAQEQIELRCGKASITLTKAGKIIIRGAYVLTRSSGVNKIKGASVQIN